MRATVYEILRIQLLEQRWRVSENYGKKWLDVYWFRDKMYQLKRKSDQQTLECILVYREGKLDLLDRLWWRLKD